MVFSGSAGTHPDCRFAFKFLINQSITQSTVYDATLIVQLSAFYMFFTVSGHYNGSLIHPYIDNEHNIQHLYLASRNNQQNNLHQNIACSFDPGNKICITCNTPHNILTPLSNAPLIFTLSDQSFPGTLSGGEGHCYGDIVLFYIQE